MPVNLMRPVCLLQGEGVTSGLRKVTDDMKTKNRAERSGAVPASAAKPSAGRALTNTIVGWS